MCKVEGCKEMTGSDERCATHAAEHTTATRISWHQRRARGLCGWPGCPTLVRDYCYCDHHAERNNARRRKAYQESAA